MGKVINVRVPSNLKNFRDSVGVGLLHLANGFDSEDMDFNTASEDENLEQTTINLSHEGLTYLEALKLRGGLSQQKIITKALLWVSNQPAHIQLSRI